MRDLLVELQYDLDLIEISNIVRDLVLIQNM
jgi:hypothetical protein